LKLGRTVIVVAAATLSLALPAGAWACLEPTGNRDGGNPEGFAEGDPVPFVLNNVDDGAKWTVLLDNKPLEHGGRGEVKNDGGSRYRASFPMPSVTPNRDHYFDVKVEHVTGVEDHDKGPWNIPEPITVRSRALGSASPEPVQAPVERPATPQPQQVEVPSGSQPSGIGGSAPVGGTGGTGGVPPTGPGGPGGGPTTPSAPGGPSGGPVDAGADVAVAIDEPTVAIEDRALAPAARAALSDRAMDGARRLALQAGSGAHTDSPDGSGRILLVLIALTAAGSAAALAVRWRRGGSGPAVEAEVPFVPSDPALEAELQEMIAEERAKLPRAPDERPPAELAAARDDPG
jgi:hypothetical protein